MAHFKMEYTLRFAPDWSEWSRSTLRKAFETALHTIGLTWKRDMLPKHFTPAGGREYGYEKRTKKYMIRKAKQEGHQNPLVGLSRRGHVGGELKRRATGIALVKASSARVRVELDVPDYTYKYHLTKPIKKYEELTTVSAAEGTEFQKIFVETMARDLENEPKKRTVKERAA